MVTLGSSGLSLLGILTEPQNTVNDLSNYSPILLKGGKLDPLHVLDGGGHWGLTLS